MQTDLNIESITFPNLTKKSIVDCSELRKVRVRGGAIFKGSVSALIDLTNDVEVAFLNQ
jgi:hypothetical protein